MTNKILRAYGLPVPEWAQGERFSEWAEQAQVEIEHRFRNTIKSINGLPIAWGGKMHVRGRDGLWVEVSSEPLGRSGNGGTE